MVSSAAGRSFFKLYLPPHLITIFAHLQSIWNCSAVSQLAFSKSYRLCAKESVRPREASSFATPRTWFLQREFITGEKACDRSMSDWLTPSSRYISLVAAMCMVLYGYDASVFNSLQGSNNWLAYFDLDPVSRQMTRLTILVPD